MTVTFLCCETALSLLIILFNMHRAVSAEIIVALRLTSQFIKSHCVCWLAITI